MKSFLPGLLAEFQGEHGADSGAMMLPDPSAWREQDWEEMLPLENREVAETVKTPTQNHKAKGLPSHKTDWLQEKEGKVQNTEPKPEIYPCSSCLLAFFCQRFLS
ncbi:zinc finger protein 343 isoform X2 [Globicephala melas]|uniref:zinc finger protein 343 isoform X2 n=1 Tax=Globicephala melas TaxID=9731 RepID=UPI003872C820